MSESTPQPIPLQVPIPGASRDLDLASLKALAHPLRVQIFDALSTYGSFTASGLAERLGESSGATSYHLRQLERHGLVHEVDGKGTSRERWWERASDPINIGPEETLSTPAGRSASEAVFRQLQYSETRLLGDFVDRAMDELPQEWRDVSSLATMNTRMTPDQLERFVAEVMQLADKYVLPNKNQRTPGSRPVHITFNAFPVVDGDVTPGSQIGENQ
jgi:DNA-binding transcriptional ArsR family regulator